MKRMAVRSFVLPMVLGPSQVLAQGPTPSIWTIPGVANVPGQNGTPFVSDAAVTNLGAGRGQARRRRSRRRHRSMAGVLEGGLSCER